MKLTSLLMKGRRMPSVNTVKVGAPKPDKKLTDIGNMLAGATENDRAPAIADRPMVTAETEQFTSFYTYEREQFIARA